jgi:sugar (pentulose or hexulose) kinase
VVDDDTGVRGALPSFDVLDSEAKRVAAGSEGLLFLPYLQGERTPIWDVAARGSYVGLGLQHGRGHLWRSLLEGIALGFVDCQAVLEDGGVQLREVVAANGGGKSALFRQILCDALGVPLAYTPKGGGTVAGAAILAGLGTGLLGSVEDARGWRGEMVRHEPDLAAHGRYRALLALRREAYAGLKGVFLGLGALRTRA